MTFEEPVVQAPLPAGSVVPLRLSGAGAAQPVTFGVAVGRGRFCGERIRARLVDGSGACAAVEGTALARWSDGSVAWVLCHAVLPEDEWLRTKDEGRRTKREQHGATLELMEEGELPDGSEAIRTDEESGSWSVETRECRAVVCRTGETPRVQILVQRRNVLADAAQIVLVDSRGRRHEPVLEEAVVEHRGKVRTTVLLRGRFAKLRRLEVRVRLSLFAGTGLVRWEVALHNSRRARHRGGLWDLGDAGSHLLKDFSIRLPLAGKVRDVSLSLRPEYAGQGADDRASVYQDSSGGESWQCRTHVNRNGEVPCRFRGFETVAGKHIDRGERALPTLSAIAGETRVTVAVPEFWQQFPKALSCDGGEIRIGLFPQEFGDLHELQGGEQKTHTFWTDFRPADEDPADLRWVFEPAVVVPDPEWLAAMGAVPSVQPEICAATDCLETVLGETLEGKRSIFAHRERVDEYGWRNYGDIFADHEQTYYKDAEPLVSHYNNQFDLVDGFLLQFLRTEDRRWYELADALARHVIDIDIYHTDEDRAVYNGGLFWFTDHYLHAHTSTHRTFSRENANGPDYGGGPGAEHNFTTGLLHYHLLTGNPDARETVLRLAEWVIGMEDGRRTILGVVDDGPTGKATVGYQKPGRGGANSINALLDAWTLTRERRYLEFAESLIRRCIHPQDDLAALDLLDVEKNWSYTMFLVSLAKYLDAKLEADEQDAMYAYGRESLLHYARWIAEHELPYFEQEERLEYPTEAWAAQEFRKANVFRLAARYAEEPLRLKLLQKGDAFGDQAWRDLMRFSETRMAARAVALVMTEGLADCAYRKSPPMPAPRTEGCASFPAKECFLPQKHRVLKMIKSPRGIVNLGLRLANPVRWRRVLD